jgi:CHAT domain-containing protein
LGNFRHILMEQYEEIMEEGVEQQKVLREYLLGNLDDEKIMRQIEEKLLLDDKFAEHILIAEDDLIEKFLDDELSEAQRESFIKVFLATPEGRQQFRFIQNVRKYAMKAASDIDKPLLKERSPSISWRNLFSSPALRFAVIILVVCGLGFGIWRIAFYKSDVDQGLAQLRLAYHGQRPIELRTTANFDYAPVAELRGGVSPAGDEQALARAGKFLVISTENSTDAKAHQAMGNLYLAEKNFKAALIEFNSAHELEPKDATIYNDLGALFLEKANQDEKEGKKGERLKDHAASLQNIELALKIDNSLLEALFNRALVLQKMKVIPQAQEAWQKYLEKDSASPWAAEAQRNLDEIKSGISQSMTPEIVLRDFMAAYREKNDEKAYRVLSRNREMITGKLIPQQLIFLFLNSADPDKSEYLSALKDAGQLEKERSKDPYFYEIADFYSHASPEQLAILKEAYNATLEGYDNLIKLRKTKEACEKFALSRTLFEQAEDQWEAKLADYWVAYCENSLDLIQDSNSRLSEVAEFSQKNNYKWLSAQVFYWFSVNENSSKEISKALNYSDLSLKFSDETFDFYNINKTYSSIAGYQLEVKQYPEALDNMAKVMDAIDAPDYSERQKWRDLDRIAKLFYELKLYSAAAAYETEAFRLNQDQIKEPSFERISLAYLSRIYGSQGKYTEAIAFAEKAREAAEKLPDPNERQKAIGYAALQTAAMELGEGNITKSLADYDQAVGIYSSMNYKLFQYEAEKGRLLCYFANKNDEAIQQAMPEVLQLFEKSRETILEEQNRDTFFDEENNTYDIAINYEFDKGNFEQALEYAENSRARSLLDWNKNPGKVEFKKGLPKIVFDPNTVTQPLRIADIRPRLPENAQLLYYKVLPDKILIWLITKDKLESFYYDIAREDLQEKVISLLNAIKNQDLNSQTQLSHVLYRTLIKPVEDHLDPDKDIFLIPDNILCHLPFVALISDKTGNYLVADHRFSYAPSANIFLIASENANDRITPRDQEKLLNIGNPKFDRQEFPGLQPLSFAEKEANEIAAFYPGSIPLLNQDATKQNIKDNISQADVVQFSGHYITNEGSALLSSFAVAGSGKDSRWANYEILGEKLERPRLIVLSACETGVERYYNGEGMIGAGRSFLALGVPLIVASQWNVDSKATAPLMENFHRFRKTQNLSTAAALQRAQLEMLNNPNPLLHSPFYWAGFFTLGGYSQF